MQHSGLRPSRAHGNIYDPLDDGIPNKHHPGRVTRSSVCLPGAEHMHKTRRTHTSILAALYGHIGSASLVTCETYPGNCFQSTRGGRGTRRRCRAAPRKEWAESFLSLPRLPARTRRQPLIYRVKTPLCQ